MHLQVNPQSSIPLYAQIVEQLRNQILSGVLQPGSSLPSVREISELIEVNSLTIQKAFKILESEKFITIKRGVGAFISDVISTLSDQQREKLILSALSNSVLHAQELGISKTRFVDLVEKCWERDSHD
jgi:GntR family transcriptional regulator